VACVSKAEDLQRRFQILCEFEEASERIDLEHEQVAAAYAAYRDEVRREAERLRKARYRARLLAKLEGQELRTCPCCGTVYVIDIPATGRPRVYCGSVCAVRMRIRAWRAAARAWRASLATVARGS
jgi:hypothetical protein